MKSSEAIKFWETILWLLAALALVVPLFVVRHIVMDLVFIKLTTFQILVELMVVVYLILVGLNPARYRPKFSWLTAAILMFAGVLIISTITSVQPVISFWGDVVRWNGLFAYLHYIAFFLVLSWALIYKQQWLRLLQVAIFVSLAVSLYSLAQYWGLSWVREATGTRLVGSMSNALVLAEYCLLLFFPTVVYGFCTSSRLLRWLLFFTALLQVSVILLTGSRGALVALALGIIIFIPAYIWLCHRRFFKQALVIVSGLIIIGGLSLWGLQQLPLSKNFILQRITTINVSSDSFQHRLHAWKIGLQAWQEKPITGFGLDNFAVAFQQYYQPLVEKTSGINAETWFNRAHNSFIDYLVMAGLFGLLMYILVLVVALRLAVVVMVNANAQKWQRSLAVALLATISAYIVFSFFAFDVVSSFIILFFLLALLNSFYPHKHKEDRLLTKPRWLLYLVAGVILVGLLPFQLQSILANRTAGRAVVALLRSDFDNGMQLLDKSLAYNTPIKPAITARMLEVGGKLMSQLSNSSDYKILLRLASLYEKYISQSINGQHFLILGNYYGQLLSVDPELLNKTNEAYQKAVELAPRRPLIYLAWGINLTKSGYYELALDKYQQAVEACPDMSLAHFWLALGHVSLGQFDKGEQSLQQATELGFKYEAPGNLLLMANAFETAGAYQQADFLYQQIIQNTNRSAESYYSVLNFYYRIGWYRKACNLAQSYLKEKPGDEAVLKLIEKINEKFLCLPPLRH